MKEFKWNELCREDYLYFLNNRLNALLLGFFHLFPAVNTMYFNKKDNGDMNAVFTKVKEKFKEPFYIEQSFWSLMKLIETRIFKDLCYSKIEDYVYFVEYKKSYHLFYRVSIKDAKSRKKILNLLKKYRSKGHTTEANMDFSRELNKASTFNDFFKNKQLYLKYKYKERENIK